MRLAGGEIATIDTVAVAEGLEATDDPALFQQTQGFKEPGNERDGLIRWRNTNTTRHRRRAEVGNT